MQHDHAAVSRAQLSRRVILAAPLLACLPSCGEEPAAKPASKPAVSGTRGFAQEIWVPYDDPSHHAPNLPYVAPSKKITASRAEEIAGLARSEVLKGIDVGYVASRTSSAPWGRLGGYTGVIPGQPGRPDNRDLAILRLRVDEVTPLYQWRAGYGFAVRISETLAQRFQRRVQMANRVRAKGRFIHIHHRGAHPERHEYKKFSREAAIHKARLLIKEAQGGADFAKLAAKHTNDDGGRRIGGRMQWIPPGQDKPTPWVTWRANWWHYHLYVAMFEDAPVGRVMPTPIVSPMGVDVLFVEERQGA